jgi:protein involved in polysaccharide export with SLBB domain
LLLCAAAAGCAGAQPSQTRSAQDAIGNSPVSAATAPFPGNGNGGGAADLEDEQRLEALWRSRQSDISTADFTIGPGDVLRISVPAIAQLSDRSVRVSEENTIDLPLAGELSVGGLTEQGVRAMLAARLHRYMKHPQVAVFVTEYRSREVAVAGAVNKPGLYTLVSHSDTILDIISRAGGMTENAAARVILIPSAGEPLGHASLGLPESGGLAMPDAAAASASEGRLGPEEADHQSAMPISYTTARPSLGRPPAGIQPGKAPPIIIDAGEAKGQTYLDLPARPGDVILVPTAGEVMVQGWVQNAGAFKISPGMTVLGAITAAGGELYSSSAEILRGGGEGGKKDIPVDISRVKSGEEPDPIVQSGDVVVVNRSVAGAIPYALYTLFSRFNTGLYPAVPFF